MLRRVSPNDWQQTSMLRVHDAGGHLRLDALVCKARIAVAVAWPPVTMLVGLSNRTCHADVLTHHTDLKKAKSSS